jgi:WD40 repeat protein
MRSTAFRWTSLFAVVFSLGACAAEDDTPPEPELEAEALTSRLTPTWKIAGGGAVAFSPSGALVATGSTAAQVQLVSSKDGKLIRTAAIRHTANSLSFSPDGSLLAVGSGGGGTTLNVRLLRVSDGAQLFESSGHLNGATAVSFSPIDNNLFASTGGDRKTKLWHADGTLVQTLDEGVSYGKRISALSFAPNGETLATNVSGNIHVWRVSDGTLQLTILGLGGGKGLAYSPDGKLISTGTQVFDAVDGSLVQTLAWPSGAVLSTAFSHDGLSVVAGGEDFINSVDDSTIRYFLLSNGAERVAYHHVGGASSYVKQLAISPDGRSLAFAVANDATTALAPSPF